MHSDHHIFQWNTFYYNSLRTEFDKILLLADYPDDVRLRIDILREELAAHALEIFTKGVRYTVTRGEDPDRKACSGLQSFLQVPVQVYSARLVERTANRAIAIRAICSAMLTAILEGFAAVDFGDGRGSSLLPLRLIYWGTSLGFLTAGDLRRLVKVLPADSLNEGIKETVEARLVPFAEVLDKIIDETDDEHASLPAFSFFVPERKRLETSLLLPPTVENRRYAEVHCYLSNILDDRSPLTEAAHSGVSLIIARLGAQTQTYVKNNEVLGRIVLDMSRPERTAAACGLMLRKALARSSKAEEAAEFFEYNWAREFPIKTPSLPEYFYIWRLSVQRLLGSVESRTGVRLWCSVRRSGKTTASRKLASVTGAVQVVIQTCNNTKRDPDTGLFIERVGEALESGKRLPRTFFENAVAECSPTAISNQRVAFVLDEYETLFGTLAGPLRTSPELRYTVVQPLLDQMVAFASENLLILLGQRPDAHFIVADQNQLSPLVHQDEFPLFEHGRGESPSEFAGFVEKVLTSRIEFDASFISAIYRETGGHPYLTVNLLTDYCDWLIDSKQRKASLTLTASDFETFADRRLTRKHLSICQEYQYFRNLVKENQSGLSRDTAPWLYATHVALRRLAEVFPGTLSCSRDEFTAIVDELRFSETFGLSADDLISTGVPSNFLLLDGDVVRPRIPLFARLCSVASPSPRL